MEARHDYARSVAIVLYRHFPRSKGMTLLRAANEVAALAMPPPRPIKGLGRISLHTTIK